MPRDIRQYARQTNFRLITGFVLLLYTVGLGLIYLFISREAALMGFLCLSITLVPVLLIIASLWIVGWIARRNEVD